MYECFEALIVHFIELLKVLALHLLMKINVRSQYLLLTVDTILVLLRYFDIVKTKLQFRCTVIVLLNVEMIDHW